MGMPPVEGRCYSYRERREKIDKALIEVRQQFHEEYMTELNKVRKVIKRAKGVEIGDIVYVTHPPPKSRSLPLGYVRSLRRGKDMEVCNVEIVTSRGVVWRTLDNFLFLEPVARPDKGRLLQGMRF